MASEASRHILQDTANALCIPPAVKKALAKIRAIKARRQGGQKVITLRLLAAFAAAVLVGAPHVAMAQEPRVFAAASMKNALDGVAEAWAAEGHPAPSISYAASSALARQIEDGAPADLFISANVEWMDYLGQQGLIAEGTRRDLLSNRLVLVATAGEGPGELAIEEGFDLAGLLGENRLALGTVQSVPAGIYAKAALESLGIWDGVADRTAQAENVRAALLLVSRGEAPLGIVYETDAASETGVEIVGVFPESSHPPIVYPVALTAAAGEDAQAAAFLDFLSSDTARPLFEAEGFTVLDAQ